MKNPYPQKIQYLLAERTRLRKEKRYQESDAIRKQIETMGYEVKGLQPGQWRTVKGL